MEGAHFYRTWYRNGLLAGSLVILALAAFHLISELAHSAGTPSTIWVAESRGVLAMTQADGSTQFEIPISPDARTLAVDGQNKTLWVFSGSDLRSYDLRGALKSSTSLSPPNGNPAILTVDPQANRVWLAVQSQLYLLDGQGRLLTQFRLPQPVTDITLDRRKSYLWVAYKSALVLYDQQGNQLAPVNTTDLKIIRALDYDIKQNQVWVVADDGLRRYTADGVLVFKIQNKWFSDVTFVAADQQGGLWAASTRELANINSAGAFSFTLAPYAGSSPDFIVDLISDPKDHSAWVASQRRVTHFGSDSFLLGDFEPSLPDGKSRLVRQLALEVAPIAPEIRFTEPTDNSITNNPRPTLKVSYTGDDIDLDSLKFQLNGNVLTVSCSTQANAATCAPSQPLPDDTYVITATIANTSGNTSQPALLQITIDTAAPLITVTSPQNGFLTNQRSLQISGQVSEASTFTINDSPVRVQNNLFTYGPVTLMEDVNTFRFKATDPAGNVGTTTLSGVLDTIPPTAPAGGQIQARISGDQVSVVGQPGSVEGGSRITIINTSTGDRIIVTASADGSFAASLPGSSGDSIQIYATDPAGNKGASTTVAVAGGGIFSGPVRFGAISPANGTTVNGDIVLVAIDLQAPPNTGVTVNDIIAAPLPGPSGLRFPAVVPLQTGANNLVVEAHTQDGRVVSQTINIHSNGPFPYRILANRAAGASPLEVEFEVLDQLGRGIRQIQVDFNGDGQVDVVTNSLAPITTNYTGTGTRQARFIVFDNAGIGHSQIVTIVLLSPSVTDASIQAIWGAMNDALTAGDKASALQFLSGGAREQYGEIFEVLLHRMPQIVTSYSTPRQSLVSADYAEYGINRMIDGVDRVFLVGFVQNEFGQWQIDSM